MSRHELLLERRKIFKRLNEINSILSIQEEYNLSVDEIALKVKELTGIEVKNIGKKCNRKGKIAKQLFWRAGFNEMISGTILSAYTGDNSRYAAAAGRIYHKENCKGDPLLDLQWRELKNKLKEYNNGQIN